MKCEIIAIGSELLTPWRQDTNSLYLTERLNEIGVVVAFKTIVGDRRKDLAAAIRTALGRTDIVITMGGLGPTEDDLTREAWADVLGTKLKRDADIVGQLYARAAQRRWTLTENNLKQADMLEGAEVLENPHGTAPGQWLDTVFAGHRKLGMLLPGPPREIKPMFDQQCMPRLRAVLPVRHIATRGLPQFIPNIRMWRRPFLPEQGTFRLRSCAVIRGKNMLKRASMNWPAALRTNWMILSILRRERAWSRLSCTIWKCAVPLSLWQKAVREGCWRNA
jgi:molybdenum cofactor synthesis domain-containing protein